MIACSNVTIHALTLINATLLLNNVTVYLIGVSKGVPCLQMKSYLETLSSLYGFKFVWIPIDKVGSTKPVAQISRVVDASGLPFEVPISAVYCNGTLSSVVIGLVEDARFWVRLLSCNKSNGINVYLGEKLIKRIGRLEVKNASINVFPFIISMLVDSLNPIGLAIFSLVSAVYLNRGRREFWRAVVEFEMAYSTFHVVLGSVLAQLGSSKVYSIIGIIAALSMIILSLRPWKMGTLLNAASSRLSKMALSKASPLIIGALSSTVAMSPCVLGAYLSAVSFLSSLPLSQRIPLTALYWVVYSLPPLMVASISVKLARKLNARKTVLALATISLILSIYSLLF